MRKIIVILITLFIFAIPVQAEDRTGYLNNTDITVDGTKQSKLTDNNYTTYITIKQNQTIKINNQDSFNHIYIIYYLNSKTGTIKYNDKEEEVGKNNFLHEYIKLKDEVNELELKYNEDVRIKEIYIFKGDLPRWVQVWQPPHKKADIMLISTHSDDEQLFFAGLIPYMVANGKKMQVVYFAHHNNAPSRLDEQLNGLWAAGLRNYPVLGYIPDAYSESLNGAISNLKAAGISTDDAMKFIIDNIRRFRPNVIVGHDENGEYGHGQHRLNTKLLEDALEKVNDESYIDDYKPFMPYKVYIHLYGQNKIKMDYDTPLDYFNGKTAFQMSQLGYKEHLSQQYTWFTKWINGTNNSITKASQITKYNPTEFGLYYSRVGYENEDGNMFYNLPEPKKILTEIKLPKEKEIKKTEEVKKEDNKGIGIYIIILVIIIIAIATLIIIKNKTSRRRRRRRRRRKH